MKTASLGGSALTSSCLAYGCWRIAGTWDPELVNAERVERGRAAAVTAYEAGYTLFDHADIYCDGVAEKLFGQVLREVPEMRRGILIASKCGIRKAGAPDAQAPYRYDFSANYIVESCEQSLRRLGVETIDLYQLHRPDYLCEPAEVARAFTQLKESGKVREFGVSNFRPSQVTMLRKACPMPLIVNQIELSLCRLEPFNDGTLDQCLGEGITPLAWSPLGGGRLGNQAGTDLTDPMHARKLRLLETLDGTARELGVSRSTVALAWLLRHPGGIVPIVGSTNPEHIREATAAVGLELGREHWYRLLEAALGQRLP
jgi:predicted oxidoreductase